MGISCTLGLQSIAQTSTNTQEECIIQAYHLFNAPVPNSSILVPMAHEMLQPQCNLQHSLTTSSQTSLEIRLDNSAEGTSFFAVFFYAEAIFAKGTQLTSHIFVRLFCGKQYLLPGINYFRKTVEVVFVVRPGEGGFGH